MPEWGPIDPLSTGALPYWPNVLENGTFDGNTDRWSGSGSINRTLGYPRLGCVELADGEDISQQQDIGEDNLYTLHWFYRLTDGATLTAGYDTVTEQFSGSPNDAWREGIMAFALDASSGGSVEFSASGGTVYVDTVTLMGAGLPISRASIASTVAADLAQLVSDAGLTQTATDMSPEGDYTAAVNEALRSLGAMNRYGDPDVARLPAGSVNDVIEAAKLALLQQLRGRYALETDVSLGPRRESRSQIAGSIDQMLSGAGGNRRITSTPLRHNDWRR